MSDIITSLQRHKTALKKRGMEHLYLIGSFSRGEETPSSDIDLLFSLSDKSEFWIFELLQIKNLLEKDMGKKVDLVEEKSLNKYMKKRVLEDKVAIF